MAIVETSRFEGCEKLIQLRDNLASVIHGKQSEIEVLLAAVLSGGSVLLEDVPGVGKTTLAKALAASIDLKFQRVQCTPDLMPADIFGTSIFNPKEGTFSFRPGPIFCNVLLVDEINRASPRTQSALLEAMGEGQATIEGILHALPPPFIVLATQNPLGFHGTFPLPEAQLDRFMVQLSLDYPDVESETKMLFSQAQSSPLEQLSPVLSQEELLHYQQAVREVQVEDSVARYIVEIAQRTRDDSRLRLGCSPRGTLMLFRAAQAAAFLDGREFVLPDDVQRMAPYVLQLRVLPAAKARSGAQARAELIAEFLQQTPVPV